MAKFTAFILAAAAIAPASAFAPVRLTRCATSLNSDAAIAPPAEDAPVVEEAIEAVEEVIEAVEEALVAAEEEFCKGMVGAEGAEPMPFRWGEDKTSVNFDPVGFSERSPDWINWYREAELKHGRICMLASLGLVVPDFIRVPGAQFTFEAVPNVLDAHDALIDSSMKQILLWISLLEVITMGAMANMNNFDREPGDFSFDPLGLYPTDPERRRVMRLKELKNGRLAMIALGGMVTGSLITGHGFPYV